MYVQIITFRLNGPTAEEFAALSDHVAPQYASVEGLVSKIFLRDPDDDGAYGGVYLWESREAADVYVREGLAAHLVESPDFADVHVRVYAVVPGPTAISGGPFAGAARAAVAG